MPPFVKPDGCVTHSPIENAILFADVFRSKQSNKKLEIPLSSFPEPKLNSFAFRSSEVKKLLFDLDSFRAVDPNGIFTLFFYKKLLILWLLKFPLFFISWLEWAPLPLVGDINSNVTPLTKSGSPSSITSEY